MAATGNRKGYPHRHNTMSVRVLLIVVVVAVMATACADPGTVTSTTLATTSTTEAQLDELTAARSRWDAAAPADYTVRSGEQLVAVHDGEVVSLGSSGAKTVDDVFDTIEDSIRDGATVEVEYDPELGYPTRVLIDLDGDGTPDVTIELSELEAMPIVQSLDELLEARATWEALGIDDYRYIVRFACNCPLIGTYEVEVRDGVGVSARPLDDAAEKETIEPLSIDSLIDDLVRLFTSPEELVEDGLVALDVRMDPELGYPRWLKLTAVDIEPHLPREVTLIATVDLVFPIEPVDPPASDGDRELLDAASAKWQAAGLPDYDFTVTIHCECPVESRGPFQIEVRDGHPVSGDGPVALIEDAFDLIADAIDAGVDVAVSYDDALGYPIDVIIDTEAVAVDGGLAFTITGFVVPERSGFIEGTVTAGPQCPVQKDPPDPGCQDKAVIGAVINISQPGTLTTTRATTDELGRYFAVLPPGSYLVEPMPVDGLLGTPAPVEVTIESGATIVLDLHYDTGIR